MLVEAVNVTEFFKLDQELQSLALRPAVIARPQRFSFISPRA
jgi:hypothetical protein